MEEITIGFSFNESEITTVDYQKLKVILQGPNKSIQYDIPRIEAFKYEATIDSSELIEGTYNRVLIGETQNQDVILNQKMIVAKSNPLSAARVKSYNEKMLFNLEKYLTEPDSIRAAEYEIAGRKLKRYSISELTAMRNRYKKLVEMEIRGVNSFDGPRSVLFKF